MSSLRERLAEDERYWVDAYARVSRAVLATTTVSGKDAERILQATSDALVRLRSLPQQESELPRPDDNWVTLCKHCGYEGLHGHLKGPWHIGNCQRRHARPTSGDSGRDALEEASKKYPYVTVSYGDGSDAARGQKGWDCEIVTGILFGVVCEEGFGTLAEALDVALKRAAALREAQGEPK